MDSTAALEELGQFPICLVLAIGGVLLFLVVFMLSCLCCSKAKKTAGKWDELTEEERAIMVERERKKSDRKKLRNERYNQRKVEREDKLEANKADRELAQLARKKVVKVDVNEDRKREEKEAIKKDKKREAKKR